jgi:hypothetical protein
MTEPAHSRPLSSWQATAHYLRIFLIAHDAVVDGGSSPAMTGDGRPLPATTTPRARQIVPTAVILPCLGFALVAGCAQIDPYQRPGMWRPDGVNEGNIAAMVQDPRDLVRGHPAQGPEWTTGTAAVDRLWQDKPRPLLLSSPPAQGGADAAPPATGAQ